MHKTKVGAGMIFITIQNFLLKFFSIGPKNFPNVCLHINLFGVSFLFCEKFLSYPTLTEYFSVGFQYYFKVSSNVSKIISKSSESCCLIENFKITIRIANDAARARTQRRNFLKIFLPLNFCSCAKSRESTS